MIDLKTQNQRIATDGKQIFGLFPDTESCDHCAARGKETHCGFITKFSELDKPVAARFMPSNDRLLPCCDLMDDELGGCGTWKVIG